MKPFYFEVIFSTTLEKIKMDETTHSRIIKKGIIKNMEGATAIAKSPHVKQQNVLIQKAMQPRNYMNKLSTWWKQNQL
jgi:hypothetical protein